MIRARGNQHVATTFDKLNLKDQETVVVINSPHNFEDELRRLKGVKIVRDTQGTHTASSVDRDDFCEAAVQRGGRRLHQVPILGKDKT